MRLRWMIVLGCVGVLAFAVVGRLWERAPFDTKRVADAETRMWFAGASGQTPMISSYAEEMLRAQFNLPAYPSQEVARRMAIAAMRFRLSKGDTAETNALPHLTEAYRVLAASSGSSFNPREAALAELAWWTARRNPDGNGVEALGERIAGLYRILYGGDHPALAGAGRLRAEAAALRDAQGANADWHLIRRLLRKSYAELGRAARSIRAEGVSSSKFQVSRLGRLAVLRGIAGDDVSRRSASRSRMAPAFLRIGALACRAHRARLQHCLRGSGL